MKKLFFAILYAFTFAAFAKPPAQFNVRDFGATGDGTNKDTVAFQKALDTCAVSGGGEVIVPAGNYLVGSVQIGNRTILRLETNSVLIGSGDTNDYPMLDVRWEGRWQPGRTASSSAAATRTIIRCSTCAGKAAGSRAAAR
jgi:polygalacturonase